MSMTILDGKKFATWLLENWQRVSSLGKTAAQELNVDDYANVMNSFLMSPMTPDQWKSLKQKQKHDGYTRWVTVAATISNHNNKEEYVFGKMPKKVFAQLETNLSLCPSLLPQVIAKMNAQ